MVKWRRGRAKFAEKQSAAASAQIALRAIFCLVVYLSIVQLASEKGLAPVGNNSCRADMNFSICNSGR
jgi:hypothetical protein